MTNRRIILGTVFLNALGYGLLIPVLPDVVRRFDADPSFVSRYFGYFTAIYAVVQFAAAPVLGNLSDRYGRRPVLLASLAGSAVDYLLMAYAPTLWLLFLGRVISGLTGASMAVAYAYMADISDERSRPEHFGLVAAALGAGIVAGPGVGGALAQVGPSAPFLAAAGLNFLNFAVALVLLPESLGAVSRRRLELARWTPLVSLRPLFRASPLTRLFWCYLLLYLAGRATSSMWALFTGQRFAWSSFEIGASFAFMGLITAVAQGVLPRVLVNRLGDGGALRMGLFLSVVTYAAIGFATRGWQLYGPRTARCTRAERAARARGSDRRERCQSRSIPRAAGSRSCYPSRREIAGRPTRSTATPAASRMDPWPASSKRRCSSSRASPT